jgi:hypothetical protein
VFRTRRWATRGYGAGEHEGVAVKDKNCRQRDISTFDDRDCGSSVREAA